MAYHPTDRGGLPGESDGQKNNEAISDSCPVESLCWRDRAVAEFGRRKGEEWCDRLAKKHGVPAAQAEVAIALIGATVFDRDLVDVGSELLDVVNEGISVGILGDRDNSAQTIPLLVQNFLSSAIKRAESIS